MPKFKPLNTKEDSCSGWKKFDSYKHLSSKTAVMLSISELPSASESYPFAFAKINEKEYILVALLGLFENENLFVNKEGKWLSLYTPAHFRSYPFSLAKTHSDNNKQVLCFDMDSMLYKENPDTKKGEERFFSNDGKLVDKVENTVKFLQKLTKDTLITQKAVDKLASYNLFSPFTFKLDFIEEQKPLKGLYRIDEEKLNSLKSEDLKDLQESNALLIAYSQLFSQSRSNTLKKLYDIKYANRQNKKNKKTVEENLDSFFGNKVEEELKFNFDNL